MYIKVIISSHCWREQGEKAANSTNTIGAAARSSAEAAVTRVELPAARHQVWLAVREYLGNSSPIVRVACTEALLYLAGNAASALITTL